MDDIKLIVIEILRIKLDSKKTICELEFNLKINDGKEIYKESKPDLIKLINEIEEFEKVNKFNFIIMTSKGKPVHVVDNTYLTTDPNKTKKDNLSELPEYK